MIQHVATQAESFVAVTHGCVFSAACLLGANDECRPSHPDAQCVMLALQVQKLMGIFKQQTGQDFQPGNQQHESALSNIAEQVCLLTFWPLAFDSFSLKAGETSYFPVG